MVIHLWRGERWGIWKVQVAGDGGHGVSDQHDAPGTIIEVTKRAIYVQTGQGVLGFLEIQPANKKRMAVADYVAGHRIDVGIRCAGKSE